MEIYRLQLDLIKELDPNLKFVRPLGQGGIEGNAFLVRKEKENLVLKITKSFDLKREAEVLKALNGIASIPRIVNVYKNQEFLQKINDKLVEFSEDAVIAILKQYIPGESLYTHNGRIFNLEGTFKQLKKDFKRKGYLLPTDLNSNNIIYNPSERQIYLIDLGRVLPIPEKTAIAKNIEDEIARKIKTLINRFGN